MSAPEIFLSYSSADRPAVAAVQKLLQARGVTTFLDRDDLIAGLPWPQALEQCLKQVKSVAVFLGRELGGWQKRELWLALDRQVREEKQGRAFPVIPVLLQGADIASAFLFVNTWIDLRGGLDYVVTAEALEAFERAINTMRSPQTPNRSAAICPFRGLRAFREEDAAFFEGRKGFAKQLLDFTLDKEVVAVVGPSGSGKSSVVQAGLVPLLRRERPPANTWDTVNFTPGNDPFHGLASALIPLLEPSLEEVGRLAKAQELGDNLAGGTTRVEAVVNRAIEKSNGTGRLLLVADQFEELFTVTPESSRRPFVQALLRAIGNAPFTLMVILRADFYSRVITLDRELSDRLASTQVNIGAMTRDELRESISAPAKLIGLEFEPGLVERILADVGSEPGHLPLVEFTLTELWQRREGNLLTNRVYNEIGSVTGALAQRAETEFAKLNTEEQTAVRRLFSRLVHVARTDEIGEDTRQHGALIDANTVTKRVANRLADARLLVTDGEAGKETLSVDVAHEVLIRNWERLRGWMNEDRKFLLWRQRLDLQVEEWQEHGRSADYLLRGAPLSEAERLLLGRSRDLTHVEQQFVQDSVAVRAREGEEKQRLRRHILAASVAVLLTIVCGVGYWWDWNRVKTRYYADYGQRWGVPFGIGVLSQQTAGHRSASYALDTRRSKVIAMRRINGSFGPTALDGDGIDAERWLKGVAEWRLSYRDDGRVGTIALWGPAGRAVLTEQYEFDPSGMTAAVTFQRASGRANALSGDISSLTNTDGGAKRRMSEISQHRLYFNLSGFVSRRMFEDNWGNLAPDALGSFGRAYQYSDVGQLTEIRNLSRDGTTLAEKTGVAQIRRTHGPSRDLVGVEWRDAKGSPVMTRDQGARRSMRLDRYGNVIDVAFYAPSGESLRSAKTHQHMRETWRYDERGNKIEMAYFADDGRPMRMRNDNCARTTASFDKRGNLIEKACFGEDGKPVLNSEGFARETLGYDERGNETDAAYFGTDLRPIMLKGAFDFFADKNGYSRETKRYNEHGHLREVAYFGADGKLALNEDGFARLTVQYDDRDDLTEVAFFGTDGKPVKTHGYVRVTQGHDERGNITQLAYYGTDGRLTLINGIVSSGFARVTWLYDGRGNKIEEAYFDTEGKPIIPWGFFDERAARVTWQYDKHGNQIAEALFGIDGKPYLNKADGYARKVTRYDEHDKVIEVAYFDRGGKPISPAEGYARAVWSYDERGNKIEEAYFDTDGRPVRLKNHHYARKTTAYDRQGNPINEAYFGADGNLLQHVTMRYDEQGNAIETAYFGVNGKPLAYKDGAAKIVQAYDAERRIIETSSSDAKGKPVLVDGIGAKALYAYDDSDRAVGVTYLDERGREIPTEVEVVKVNANTTAARVKLSAGDRLLAYDGERLTCGQRLAVLTHRSGTDLRLLTVRRGRSNLSFQVSAGQLGVVFRNVRAVATPHVSLVPLSK
jgi:energy-coupling factor transporter ATP-binding protein EcfA2